MGTRLSTHNKKRASSRLLSKQNKGTGTGTGTETATVNGLNSLVSVSTPPTSTSTSQSSEGVIRLGRKFHNEQSSAYWFPNDDEEMDRLVGVSTMFNTFMTFYTYNIHSNISP